MRSQLNSLPALQPQLHLQIMLPLRVGKGPGRCPSPHTRQENQFGKSTEDHLHWICARTSEAFGRALVHLSFIFYSCSITVVPIFPPLLSPAYPPAPSILPCPRCPCPWILHTGGMSSLDRKGLENNFYQYYECKFSERNSIQGKPHIDTD